MDRRAILSALREINAKADSDEQAADILEQHQIEFFATLRTGPLIPMPEQPTLRDQFAMAALPDALEAHHQEMDAAKCARCAYELADAMLEARKQ